MPEIILTTKRLRLEKIGEEHKKDLFKLLSNPKVHKYFPKILDDRGTDLKQHWVVLTMQRQN
ncbi:MAG: hypothetical protein JW927_12185 [Deltaproteobacteria bacterium]|nr:hypothetical protein [Deltaproteobacteria bacterium]